MAWTACWSRFCRCLIEKSAWDADEGGWWVDAERHQDFIQRATTFLEANARRRRNEPDTFVWGQGDDRIRVMGPADRAREEELLALASAWRARAFDAGFAWPGGPAEY